MSNKKWFTSKTLWVNTIALGYTIYQLVTGTQAALDPQVQMAILAGINWVLRLITKQGIEA